jgi:hypothetical protein
MKKLKKMKEDKKVVIYCYFFAYIKEKSIKSVNLKKVFKKCNFFVDMIL